MARKKSDSPQHDDRIKIGARIRDCRQKKQLTLEDMCTKTGLAKDVLAGIEGGN